MSPQIIDSLILSLWQTIHMVVVSASIAAVLGIPLGVIVLTTDKGHILENIPFNRLLGVFMNATRSLPFIILMVAIIPLTRLIIGTSIGTAATIVPLTIAAIPFVGRLIEGSLREVDYGLIEAALAMGSSPFEIIRKVLLPEALPSIISGLTITVIALIGYSAMAGVIGGGGLGDLAIRYGYQRFRPDVMLATVIVLIVMVQFVQFTGDYIARRVNKK
ncbi:MAG: ABC-type transporter, integral rane subunit [Firmicutes bacterium]|nr:ABC-type transporter, integral rane subunit [Bacillota bacterium]